MGYIEPGKQQVLKVYYLPGVPGVFCRAFQIQVGHLEPAKICLKGEGTFPRIHLDLPRNIKGNAKYEKILQKAQEKLDKGSQRDEAIALGEAVAAEPHMDDSGTMISFDNWAGRDTGVHFFGAMILPERAGSVPDTEQ
ncbi:hydrocephalus-inducing protein-like [Melopsittacus undulatus]|uniref:hydrocephalus-inducing protein-like n=1 Tax=Melopsittacus undulatus TaxID=13146 RepID=UPI00146D671A|nr:hydrocephalus-inducing protein-like [Melopsittacus undulatus]